MPIPIRMERDFRLDYTLQDGPLKGLGVSWRNATQRGNVTTDAGGFARVSLPAYFGAATVTRSARSKPSATRSQCASLSIASRVTAGWAAARRA